MGTNTKHLVDELLKKPTLEAPVVDFLLKKVELRSIHLLKLLKFADTSGKVLAILKNKSVDQKVIKDDTVYLKLLDTSPCPPEIVNEIQSRQVGKLVEKRLHMIIRAQYREDLTVLEHKLQSKSSDINLDGYRRQAANIRSLTQGASVIQSLKFEHQEELRDRKWIFNKLLGELKDKVDELGLRKGLDNRTAWSEMNQLYNRLENLGERYFDSDSSMTTSDFFEKSLALIKNERTQEIVATHRGGFFGKIGAILNNILKWIGQLFTGSPKIDVNTEFKSSKNRRYEFWDNRTDTQKIMTELEENVKAIEKNQQHGF